jgi:transmembrane sensor
MDDRFLSSEDRAATSERAFEWLGRLEQDPARNNKAFAAWLLRSPQNVGEIIIATSIDIVLRNLFRRQRFDVSALPNPNVLPYAEQSQAERRSPKRHRMRRLASVGLGVAAAVTVALAGSMLVRAVLQPDVYSTSVGEQRAIELPDGSAIAINAQSSIRVAYSEAARDVYLTAGQAMFTVARDAARPFRVHVTPAREDHALGESAVIQALGTKFDVRLRADRINVAVLEGLVQIRADARGRGPDVALDEIAKIAEVAAGQTVSIEAAGLVTPPAPINASDVSAWQQRRLVFADETLADIVEEFQRYNRTPRIRIEGEALRSRRLSGVFDADYPEALLLYLESDDGVVLETHGDELIVRLRDETPGVAATTH